MSGKPTLRLTIAIAMAAFAAYLAVTVFPRVWSPEHRLSDWMVTFASPSKSVDPDIVLVTVRDDHEYRQRLKSLLPTDRSHLAQLSQCLSEGGASVIGFDMLFDWPDTDDTDKFERVITEVAKATPIIVGLPGTNRAGTDDSEGVRTIKDFAARTNAQLGVIDLLPNTVRMALGNKHTEPLNTFANAVALQSGKPIKNSKPLEEDLFRIAWSNATERLDQKPVRFTDYASLDIIDLCTEYGPQGLSSMIGEKVVLVGSRAQNDQHVIPLSTQSEYQNGMSGLEIHATIIAQTLRGPHILEISGLLYGLMMLVAAALGMYVQNHPRHRPNKKFVLVFLGIVITAVTIAIYAFGNVLLPLAPMLIAMSNGAFIEQAAQGLYRFPKKIVDQFKKAETEGA